MQDINLSLKSSYIKFDGNQMKIAKNIKIVKIVNKIINVKNCYKPLEIQATPFHLTLILISWIYDPI